MPIIPLNCFIQEDKYSNFIEWYKDDEIGIFFDKIPNVNIRFALPYLSKEEKKELAKYPFINESNLKVVLMDYILEESYEFTIPKGFIFDGASIIKFFHRIIGANTDNRFLIAACIHDYLCIHKDVIDYNRALSTDVFNALLKVGGVGSFKRFWMKNSVALFQTIWVRDWRE